MVVFAGQSTARKAWPARGMSKVSAGKTPDNSSETESCHHTSNWNAAGTNCDDFQVNHVVPDGSHVVGTRDHAKPAAGDFDPAAPICFGIDPAAPICFGIDPGRCQALVRELALQQPTVSDFLNPLLHIRRTTLRHEEVQRFSVPGHRNLYRPPRNTAQEKKTNNHGACCNRRSNGTDQRAERT